MTVVIVSLDYKATKYFISHLATCFKSAKNKKIKKYKHTLRTMCQIYSKLTIKTIMFGTFIVLFENI